MTSPFGPGLPGKSPYPVPTAGTGYGGAPARPAPTTYQQGQTNQAQDLWDTEGAQVYADQSGAAGALSGAASGAEAAYNAFMGGSAANVANWSPLAQQGYNASQIGSWMQSYNASAEAPVLPAGAVPAVTAGQSNAAATATQGVDTSALKNFDPSAAGMTYASGAEGAFNLNLKNQLYALQNQDASSGRINTGFFDRDRGTVINTNTQQFNDALAQAALQFSGQRLGALEAGTQADLSKAGTIDTIAAQQAEENAQLATTASADTAANALTARGQDISAYGAQTARESLGLSGATTADELALQKAQGVDAATYARAQYMDTQNFQRGQTGLEAALGRESEYLGEYNTASSNAASFTSANLDRANADQAAADTRALIARLFGSGTPTTGAAAKPLTGPASGGFTNVVGNPTTGMVQW